MNVNQSLEVMALLDGENAHKEMPVSVKLTDVGKKLFRDRYVERLNRSEEYSDNAMRVIYEKKDYGVYVMQLTELISLVDRNPDETLFEPGSVTALNTGDVARLNS